MHALLDACCLCLNHSHCVRTEQAAEAAVDDETRAELPVPSNAVTEEDAQREAGVEPETAATGEVSWLELPSLCTNSVPATCCLWRAGKSVVLGPVWWVHVHELGFRASVLCFVSQDGLLECLTYS